MMRRTMNPERMNALQVGDRVVHPDWLGAKRAGSVIRVANRWHADVQFDGWTRTVRAALGSLEREEVAEGTAGADN